MGLNADPVIEIQPLHQCISVTWMLGSLCNYECQYCPAELHDSTSRPHDLAVMQQAWQNVYDRVASKSLGFKINFTGGEVTANKNSLPLFRWLRQQFPLIHWMGITTNGSASLRYYQELAQCLEAIAFSTHSEFMNEQEFFSKVEAIDKLMIRPSKSVHVNVMDEHWNRDRNALYCQWLASKNISHSVNTVYHDVGTRSEVWQKGQTNLDMHDINTESIGPVVIGNNCRMIHSSGAEQLAYGATINNKNLNRFQGWHCQAGTLRFYIDKHLKVHSGECCHDDLGHALTDFQPLEDGTICRFKTCSPCVDDIITPKKSINYEKEPMS